MCSHILLVRENPDISIEIFDIDFAQPGPDKTRELGTLLKRYDISVLVNNVGVNVEMPTLFQESAVQDITSIVNVNVLTTVQITRIVISSMVAKKRGFILNISSLAGVVPTPLLAPYSGSKSFVNAWSEALSAEVAQYDVHVETICPFFVCSNMSKRSRPTFDCPTADNFAKKAVSYIGRDRFSNPWMVHDIYAFFLQFIPGFFLLQKNYDMHVDIRKRALRKKARQKAKQ